MLAFFEANITEIVNSFGKRGKKTEKQVINYKMATKFKSPKRWDDYQMNKALCFVVLAVISCVILLGFASASLTSYFAQVNANKNGYVYSYSYTATVGDTDPNLDIDGFFVDSYHYNTVCL